MKKLLISLALIASPLLAQAQVGVSVNIGEPGFYGQINLGNAAPPPVVYPQPVIIQAGPGPALPPLYLRVPPDHHKNWGRYCQQYNACGRKVFFVSDDWYRNTYAPQYKREHAHDNEHREEHHDDREHHDEHEHHDDH
jgi:hypothetical protein